MLNRRKKEEAEEAGHGQVAHCCRVTEAQGESGRVGGQARRCRFTQGDGVG